MLTATEIANALEISRDALKYRLHKLGIMPARRVGQTDVYHESVVDQVRRDIEHPQTRAELAAAST